MNEQPPLHVVVEPGLHTTRITFDAVYGRHAARQVLDALDNTPGLSTFITSYHRTPGTPSVRWDIHYTNQYWAAQCRYHNAEFSSRHLASVCGQLDEHTDEAHQ